MARYKRSSFLVDPDERSEICEPAELMQCTESAAVRVVAREKLRELNMQAAKAKEINSVLAN